MGKAGAEAAPWCVKYGLAQSARFSIGLYGPDLASSLARSWCHRMEYYYGIFCDARQAGYEYVLPDHEAYVEPPELA
eukprot:2476487-Lingulodinium_polyedra.AAC.1